MTRFYLVGNNGYSVQDNPEPEEWVRPLVAAGITHLEYFADHMEPVIYENVIRDRSEYFQATMDTIRRSRLSVASVTTGRISYLLNVLSHPYADARAEGMRWCRRMVDLAVALGARYCSGHFDYISQKDARKLGARAAQRIVDGLVELSEYAARHGLAGICLEQMHGPQLRPYIIPEMEQMLHSINARSAVPVYPMCDTGHMAHVSPADPDHGSQDKNPYAWLSRKYAGLDVIFVHIQQTDNQASRHWPFTAPFNAQGIIEPKKVVEAVERSGVAEAYLSLEILYARGTPLDQITPDIVASAEAFRGALRGLGYACDEQDQAWKRPATP